MRKNKQKVIIRADGNLEVGNTNFSLIFEQIPTTSDFTELRLHKINSNISFGFSGFMIWATKPREHKKLISYEIKEYLRLLEEDIKKLRDGI